MAGRMALMTHTRPSDLLGFKGSELERFVLDAMIFSEIADEFVSSVSDYLREGDSVTVRVLGMKDERRWELSVKQAKEGEPSAARPLPRPLPPAWWGK